MIPLLLLFICDFPFLALCEQQGTAPDRSAGNDRRQLLSASKVPTFGAVERELSTVYGMNNCDVVAFHSRLRGRQYTYQSCSSDVLASKAKLYSERYDEDLDTEELPISWIEVCSTNVNDDNTVIGEEVCTKVTVAAAGDAGNSSDSDGDGSNQAEGCSAKRGDRICTFCELCDADGNGELGVDYSCGEGFSTSGCEPFLPSRTKESHDSSSTSIESSSIQAASATRSGTRSSLRVGTSHLPFICGAALPLLVWFVN